MLNLPDCLSVFRPLAHVTVSTYVRPSKAGFRPVVVVFSDGKIFRSHFGPVVSSKDMAASLAARAAEAGLSAAARTRRETINRRVEAVCVPCVVFCIGLLSAVQLFN